MNQIKDFHLHKKLKWHDYEKIVVFDKHYKKLKQHVMSQNQKKNERNKEKKVYQENQ